MTDYSYEYTKITREEFNKLVERVNKLEASVKSKCKCKNIKLKIVDKK